MAPPSLQNGGDFLLVEDGMCKDCRNQASSLSVRVLYSWLEKLGLVSGLGFFALLGWVV